MLPHASSILSRAVPATTYAPGHDFWHGQPVDWVLRGTLAFCVAIAPALFGGLLLLAWARRTSRVMRLLFLPGYLALTLVWYAMLSNPRDGDMPWYIGQTWGLRLTPVAVALTVLLIFVVRDARRPRRPAGFEVVGGGL